MLTLSKLHRGSEICTFGCFEGPKIRQHRSWTFSVPNTWKLRTSTHKSGQTVWTSGDSSEGFREVVHLSTVNFQQLSNSFPTTFQQISNNLPEDFQQPSSSVLKQLLVCQHNTFQCGRCHQSSTGTVAVEQRWQHAVSSNFLTCFNN